MLNVSLLVALLTASYFLFYGGPDTYAVRSIGELWNLGHVMYFGVLVYLLWRGAARFALTRNRIWLLALLITLVLGVSIEVLQYGVSRSADLMDLSRNFSGALLVLGFIPGLMLPVGKFLKSLLQGLIVCFALFNLSPLVIALSDEAFARTQFPVLSNFETPFELDRWVGSANRVVVEEAEGLQGRTLKIDLDTQLYSGLGMQYFPTDWRGYRSLNLNIYNSDLKPLSLTFKVYDARHRSVRPTFRHSDRFNRQYQLKKGWNRIQIQLADIQQSPENRDMDMSEIVNLSFFVGRLKQPSTIYLDKVYLEN